ncbi:MAG: zinc ribbon domain-containing protein, partial [Candidatus Thorarchaeota archaeon]
GIFLAVLSLILPYASVSEPLAGSFTVQGYEETIPAMILGSSILFFGVGYYSFYKVQFKEQISTVKIMNIMGILGEMIAIYIYYNDYKAALNYFSNLYENIFQFIIRLEIGFYVLISSFLMMGSGIFVLFTKQQKIQNYSYQHHLNRSSLGFTEISESNQDHVFLNVTLPQDFSIKQFCDQCGNKYRRGEKYCTWCGAKI